MRLFRVVLSSRRTDYVVTDDIAQDDTPAVREVCSIRRKIEQVSPRNQTTYRNRRM